MRTRLLSAYILVPILLVLFSACKQEEEAIPIGPPEGWVVEGNRWWVEGADTSGVFRDLETLLSMNVPNVEYFSPSAFTATRQPGGNRRPFVNAVKQSLIRLYRNNPEVVDSLFERYVTPEIEKATVGEDVEAFVEQYKRRGYELIRSHFREPMLAKQIGKDIPMPPYPDSLREKQIEGTVRMQIYLDSDGKPLTISRLEGVHPTLDQMAMNATTQMEWSPAYYLRKGSWRPGPSWVRYNITFRAPER